MKRYRGEYLDNMCTVDPGWHTAISYWLGIPIPTVVTFTFESGLEEDGDRFDSLCRKFRSNMVVMDPAHVWIEGTEMWEGSLVSLTAAKRGDIFKLSYLIGHYRQVCRSLGIPVTILTPREWKGQLNKKKTALRVSRAIGVEYKTVTGKLDDHRTDSVGIGLSVVGKL